MTEIAHVMDPVRLEINGMTYSLSSLGFLRVVNMKIALRGIEYLVHAVAVNGLFTFYWLVDLIDNWR